MSRSATPSFAVDVVSSTAHDIVQSVVLLLQGAPRPSLDIQSTSDGICVYAFACQAENYQANVHEAPRKVLRVRRGAARGAARNASRGAARGTA